MGENFKRKSNIDSGNTGGFRYRYKKRRKVKQQNRRHGKIKPSPEIMGKGAAEMQKFIDWINNNGLVIAGAVFAFMISILSRKDGSILDRLSGAVLCSLFSTGLFYGIIAVFPNCPQEAAVAIGSFVGFYGVDEVKKLVLAKIRNFLKGSSK